MFQQNYIQEKTYSTLYISAWPSFIHLHVDKIIIEKLYNKIQLYLYNKLIINYILCSPTVPGECFHQLNQTVSAEDTQSVKNAVKHTEEK